ncbi:ISAs1 family transposase [Xenorhabdus nematophila]|nr:ISAs1 family transposase [Xenorhabdus nematophila]KHD27175.1 H repeat-associated protein ydcC [Xenorhabdus nematophila]MBA0019799.1 ISAs1 family transposase [Xenorhabdus nematophila]MCB4426938.1 ISAs1 family transposase [Xenorhabdus nematophila]QNJ38396.1 ISAs1 family transposase [Xenorhabdus nematophila]
MITAETAMQATTLSKAFGHLTDPRVSRTKQYALIDILTISICAVICGCEGFNAIEEYGKSKEDWFRQFLDLPNGIPSHDTFNDVINRLDPQECGLAFTQWVNSLAEISEDIIALDGKTLRGTLDKANDAPALHLVSAWSVANQLCFGQMTVSDKSNEITAIPKLLALLDIEGSTITIDAMGCQYAIANQIVTGKADYVLTLKGNQGEFYDDIKLFLNTQLATDFTGVSPAHYRSTDGEHGRIEQRQLWLINEVNWLQARHPQWHTLGGIAVVESWREEQGKTASYERHYYITSHRNASAEFIACAIRSHWHIENKLHWQLDVSFGEDSQRLRSGHAAENVALMNKIALNLLKNEKSVKVGVKTKRQKAGWDNGYMLKVLTMGFTSV